MKRILENSFRYRQTSVIYLIKSSFFTFQGHILYQISKTLKTRFDALQVKFPLISGDCGLRVGGKHKMSGFFCR